MKRKLLSVLVSLLLAAAVSMPAFALDFRADRVGSVSVTILEPDKVTPVAGLELSLYYVAAVKQDPEGELRYLYTDEFADCGVALDDMSLTSVLESYVSSASVTVKKTVTDEQGTAVFSDLPLGLYFVKQSNIVGGYTACRSFLVTVPYEEAGDYVYDVDASPKTEIAMRTDITATKVWNTDETTEIADHITVQLLRDGVVVGTATLDEQNQWKTVFYDMPVGDDYSILEVDVPAGFTATYTESGYEFTVINSPYLIQTGQLIWPIPVLALIGLLLITVGTALVYKGRRCDD